MSATNISRLLIIIVGFTVFYGIYNIMLTLLKIPKYNKEKKSIFSLFIKKKKNNNYEDNYSHLTHEIAKIIKLPNNFKEKLNSKLRIADINSNAELYIANLINKSLTYFIFAILFISIHKIVTIIFIFLGIQNIFKGYKNIDTEIRLKTSKIEKEIPRFLDFITNSFKFNKNVKEALESYQKIAGEYFKSNITITIADMSTGNYEVALKRLDTRINSYNFSRVVRAIIQVVKGDENIQYLENLYKESANKEYEALKLESSKKIRKVESYSKIILLCMMIIVFTILGLMFIKNFNQVNGVY